MNIRLLKILGVSRSDSGISLIAHFAVLTSPLWNRKKVSRYKGIKNNTTMLYRGEVIVLAGFVEKMNLQSQLCAYSSNANLVYFNANLFKESKVNLINICHKSYSSIQLLFTSSSDYFIRIYRFTDSRAKKYIFDLELVHSYKFDDLIIDFDMKCILSSEKCVYSHELGANKVSADQFDEGMSPLKSLKLKNKLSHQRQSSITSSVLVKASADGGEVNRTPSSDHKMFGELNISRESSSEYVGVPLKGSIETGLNNYHNNNNNNNNNNENNSVEFERSTTPRYSGSDEASLSNNEGHHGHKRSLSSASVSAENLNLKTKKHRLKGVKKFKSQQHQPSQQQQTSNEESNSNDSSSDGGEEEEKDLKNSNHSLLLESSNQLHPLKGVSAMTMMNESAANMPAGLHSNSRLSVNSMSGNVLSSNHNNIKHTEEIPGGVSAALAQKDEIFLSFTDLDGIVVLKRLSVNRNGNDLAASFANPTQNLSIDLGISGSYCRFMKCMDVEVRPEKQIASISKKQLRKQVKFQQRKQQSVVIDEADSSGGHHLKEEVAALKESENVVVVTAATVEEIREVNLNLIVTNLMGEVIEFKNVPQQGLSNPIAFPTVDHYNSGVTGLCIKTIDSLEILVSYFDGSVIFFDMNSEDAWNLKLSQPLNSNHFGVYYENTQDTDIVILISDDTIQIYELNSYHIN